MIDYYEDIGEIMGTLEAYVSIIGTMVLNGKCKSGNRYLREASVEMKRALSDLSDALFEVSTSPVDEGIEEDDDDFYEPLL